MFSTENSYLTLIHAFHEVALEGRRHRGIWIFENHYGIQLRIRPLVVPWYNVEEVTLLLSEVAHQSSLRPHFSNCHAWFFKENLPIIEIWFWATEGVQHPRLAPTIDNSTADMSTPSNTTDPTDTMNTFFIRLTQGYAITVAESALMLAIIRALRRCLDLNTRDFSTFFYRDESSRVSVRLNPSYGYDSVPTLAVVEALVAAAKKEYVLMPGWRALSIVVAKQRWVDFAEGELEVGIRDSRVDML